VLGPALAAGLVAVVAVVLLALAVGSINVGRVFESGDAVAHTYAVNAALQQLLATATDAETGQRGFIITGDAAYLEPYERARATIAGALERVRQLTADHREQQDDLTRLAAATNTKLTELAETISLRDAGGFAAAQAMVATHAGKRTMDTMRGIVAAMAAREDVLLSMRHAEAARYYRQARVAQAVTAALALAALGFLFFAARRVGLERRMSTETAERLRVTLASIGDAVIVADAGGRLLTVNPVAEAMTGWRAEDAAGRPVADVFVIVNEQSRAPVESPIGRALRERTIVGLANHTVLLAKDGREIPVDDSASPIMTADGLLIGAVMVFRDVTRRRKVERERLALIAAERFARRDAEEANRTKDEFLAMVAHEVRTPLNAVVGWADLLRSGTLPDDKRARAVEAIFRNAKRQSTLIEELIDVSRIISGKLQLDRGAVDPAALIKAAADMIQPAADAKRIQFNAATDLRGGPLHADAPRLLQVLGNLLTNAVKFTPEGGSVSLTARHAGESLEVAVEDSGEGIASAFLPFVFEPFRQGDGSTTRRHAGLGLGLAIVKSLIEAHGGTVSVQSDGPGQGSRFVIRLPAIGAPVDREEPDAAASATDGRAAAGARTQPLRGLTLLIVEDHDDSREALRAILEQRGGTVRAAASAAEALAILHCEAIDILISDVAMPGEDGYALIRHVRALDTATAGIVAVALTARAREEDRREALRAGFQRHFTKPLDADALVEALLALRAENRTS
jgi:PAS domain S-box-containing protein